MSQFRNLVFEGGGVKGIAYSGAIAVLEEQNILGDIRRVAGTSAGAITAVLLALGSDSKKIGSIIGGTDFRQFMDDSFGFLGDAHRLVEDYGWFKGDKFGNWMQKQIYACAGNKDLTFGQLKRLATDQPTVFRELFMVGTNLSLQWPMVYSAENTPDMKIWEATRISMSIPLFFAAIKREGQVLVDGGVTWNYPLDLFDDRKYLSPAVAGTAPGYPTVYDDNHVFNPETLGFRVDTQDEIKAEKEGWRLPPAEISNLVDYLKSLVGFMGDMANKMHLHDNDWHRTVALDAAGVRTTDFSLPDEKVQLLIANGRSGAETYFKWFNDQTSDPVPKNRLTP